LVAICLHVGDSPRAGHYFSVVRNIKDDIWRRYNDERVTVGSKQLDQKFLNHATPYICFYKGERLHLTNANNITANNLAENSKIVNLDSGSDSDIGNLYVYNRLFNFKLIF
jgi:hypothetical protein